MNQDYRGRVSRWLESGGDPKYVNVKGKADKRHQEEAEAHRKIGSTPARVRGAKENKLFHANLNKVLKEAKKK